MLFDGLTIHQIVPSLEYGDAISNYALLVKRILREGGANTRLFAENIHPRMRRDAEPVGRAPAADSPDTIWLLHYSTRTSALEMLANAVGPVGLIYHNVTPPNFAEVLGGDVMAAAWSAREELTAFFPHVAAAAGDSSFNVDDLRSLGAPDPRLIPLALDFAPFDTPPRRLTLDGLREGDDVNFLTVGRLAPHKKLEDVIKVFYYYHHYVNSRSRLHIVGDGTATSPYVHQLKLLIADLAIPNIYLTGKIRFRDLLAYYHAADIYLCMSEHEGFCVPLLEAMYLGVPVLAYGAGAIPETMGDAGALVRDKRADVVAELANLILSDKTMRTRMVERQRERVGHYMIPRLRRDLKSFVDEMRGIPEPESTTPLPTDGAGEPVTAGSSEERP